ncbi:MAG: hypothetical protein KIS87_02640 [Phycisphaeraceae bacterium]|nr:hypothetical protein [Phycisphaeraceae bacterium]
MSTLIAATIAVTVALAQPEQAGPLATLPLPRLEARLVALTPSDPRGYLLLAEEVAYEADGPGQIELARTLYALAFEHDRRRNWSAGVGACASMGLAAIARVDSEQRWLAAMASRLDRRYAAPEWMRGRDEALRSEIALAAAEAMGEARAGQGIRARELLRRPGVREALERYGRLVGLGGAGSVLWNTERYAAAWPCPECRNERAVFVPGTDPPSYRVCATCRGDPGPQMSAAELIDQLRLESRLLEGVHRSWAAQLAVDGGAPLRDLDPETFAASLGVDAERCLWRGGTWVRPGAE